MYSKLIFGLLISLVSLSLSAAEFCVDSVAEFRAAIDVAESNNEDDVIKLKVGLYETNGSTFYYDEPGGYDITISGGWQDFFFVDDCAVKNNNSPLGTVLDGSNNSQALYVRTSHNAHVEVSGMTFQNGNTNQSGGGLYISRTDNLNTGTITVANNAFISNQASFGAAMALSGADTFHIRNNLIIANNAIIRNSVSVIQNNANGIYFNNNTVIGNTSDDVAETGAVYLYTSGTSNLLVANNILTGNQLEDLDARNSSTEATYYVFNNNVDVLVGSVPDVFTGNFNLPNRFESGFFSFTPDADSPLVNAGRNPCGLFCPVPTPFENDWELGENDVLNNYRIEMNAVDIGAFESFHARDLIFWDRFD